MVYGEGAPIGPDLSNVAREMTVDQIREALLQPDARIAPGYGLVTVQPARWAERCADSRAAGPGSTLPLQDLKGVLPPALARSGLRRHRGESNR